MIIVAFGAKVLNNLVSGPSGKYVKQWPRTSTNSPNVYFVSYFCGRGKGREQLCGDPEHSTCTHVGLELNGRRTGSVGPMYWHYSNVTVTSTFLPRMLHIHSILCLKLLLLF